MTRAERIEAAARTLVDYLIRGAPEFKLLDRYADAVRAALAPESGGREPGPRFRLEGKGVIDTEGGLSLCTGCGKLPPHAGCKAICAACSPPNGTCYCEGCTVAGKGAPSPSSPAAAQGDLCPYCRGYPGWLERKTGAPCPCNGTGRAPSRGEVG